MPYIIDIGTGANHSVFLNKYGHVVSSGKNLDGRIGTGNTTSSLVPVPPVGLPPNMVVSRIFVGNTNTFFIMSDMTIYATGDNSAGQFGIGNLDNFLTPVHIEFFTTNNIQIKKIAAGWYHTIFLAFNGDVYVCGDNKFGQLGNGADTPVVCGTNNIYGTSKCANMPKVITPIKLDGLNCWDVAAGKGHSVFVTNDEKLYTTGWNLYGQLGNCSENNSNTPVLIDTGNNRVFFAYAGMHHTMYISGGKRDQSIPGDNTIGMVYACGDNRDGQLGIPRQTTYQCQFTKVKIGDNDERCYYVSAGQTHTLFMTNRLQMYAVGKNTDGQLGLGHYNTVDKAQAIPIFKDKMVFKMEAGANHSVFVTTEGIVYATGDNTMRGQLGISDITKTNTPLKSDIAIESYPGAKTYEQQIVGI